MNYYIYPLWYPKFLNSNPVLHSKLVSLIFSKLPEAQASRSPVSFAKEDGMQPCSIGINIARLTGDIYTTGIRSSLPHATK